MSDMDDLIAFVRQQLAEDERVAVEAQRRQTTSRRMVQGRMVDVPMQPAPEWRRSVWPPARVLAEVEAKRRVLDVILAYEAKIDGEWGCSHSAKGIEEGRCPEIRPDEIDAIRLLAQPYAGQPGWREEWRTN